MSETRSGRGQAVIWVILTAIIAIGLFLVIRNTLNQHVSPQASVNTEATPTVTIAATVSPTPTPTVASDAQIDAQLKAINDQSKTVDQSLSDTPIDVMK